MLYSYFAIDHDPTDNWSIVGFGKINSWRCPHGPSLIDNEADKIYSIGSRWTYDDFYGLFEDLRVVYDVQEREVCSI